MVPANEKFERKIPCIFNYTGDLPETIAEEGEADDSTDLVNQDLLKKVVYGENGILEKKIENAKQEISSLKIKEKELK